MPRAVWPLRQGRPCIGVLLKSSAGQWLPRSLIADSGAGSQNTRVRLILNEADCLNCGGNRNQAIQLGGAFVGTFPTYIVRVAIPALGFDRRLRAVAVPSAPAGFDGLACFSFLNRFTYGNFGDPSQFGLES